MECTFPNLYIRISRICDVLNSLIMIGIIIKKASSILGCAFFLMFSRTHSEIFCKYKYDVSKQI